MHSSAARCALITTLAVVLLSAPVIPAISLDPTPRALDAPSGPAVPDAPWWPEWLAAFDHDGDRIDDEAEHVAADAVARGAPDEPVGVIVNYDHWPSVVDAAALAAIGAEVVYSYHHVPGSFARVPASSIQRVSALPGIVAAEWDAPIYATLDISAPATQAHDHAAASGANAVYNGQTAQSLGYNGEGMVVAVLDTGMADDHPTFAGKWVTGAITTSGTPVGCVNPADDDGHGTHVASTAIGNPAGDNHKGTAMAAKLVEIKISAGIGSLNTAQDAAFDWILDYNAAIDAAAPLCGVNAADRIDVATLSFGSTGRGGPNAGTTEGFINALVSSGVVVTIAAGNCGPSASATCTFEDDDNGISSPANAAGAIAIAAANDGATVNRGNDFVDSYSSRGPDSAGGNDAAAGGATNAGNLQDRHRKPDVMLPGTNINAANVFHITGADYVDNSGTSMAAPHAAGLSALLLQAGESVKASTGGVNVMRPTGTGFDGSGDHVSGQHPVRDALIHGAAYGTGGVPAPKLTQWAGPGADGLTWNNGWGYGEANAFASICWAWADRLIPAGASPPAVVATKCGLGPGSFTAEAGGPYSGVAGAIVALAGTATGGTPPYTFAWDTDGDGATDATGAAPNVVFSAGGTWTVGLTVTDSIGAVDTDTASATIAGGSGGGTGDEITVDTWDFDIEECDSTLDGLQEGWYWSRPVFPETNGAAEDWHAMTFQPDSGGCAWYHGSDASGLSPHNQLTDLVSPDGSTFTGACMSIPAGHVTARFNFKVAGEMEKGAEEFDYVLLQSWNGCDADVDNWAFTDEAKLSGVRGDLATGVYEDYSVDLTPLIGAGPFMLRFRAITDANNLDCSDVTGTLCTGYQLDSFRLLATEPGGGSPPGVFTLTATPAGAAIDLAWSASSSATAYTVHRSTAPLFTPTASNQIGSGGASTLSFSDTTAVAGVTYYYTVVSSNGAGTRLSNTASAILVIDDLTPPSAPVVTAQDLATDGEVSLSWSAATDAESGIAGYDVHRATTSGFVPDAGNKIATVGGATLARLDDGLTNGQTYFYVVVARNGAGLATASAEASATPTLDTVPPAQVVGLTVVPAPQQLLVSWTPNTETDLSGYELYRDSVLRATTGLNSLLDTGLTNGVTYCYEVRALDTVGNAGPFSEEVCGIPQVPPEPPVVGWPQFHRDPAKTGRAVDTAVFGAAPVALGTVSLGGPAIGGVAWGDIDGDASSELVVGVGTVSGAIASRVVAFDVNAGVLVQKWSHDLPHNALPQSVDGWVMTPALAESGDGDAGLEVVVVYGYDNEALVDGNLALLDGGTGAQLGLLGLGFISKTHNPSIGQLDEDAEPEVAITRSASGAGEGNTQIYDLSGGAISLKGQATSVAQSEGAPAIADLDADGVAEVVSARWTSNTAGGAYIVSGSGTLLKDIPLLTGGFGVAVANLDGDPVQEIVVTARDQAGAGGSLYVLDSTAGTIAGFAVAASADAGFLWNTAAIGNVDADAAPEIVVAGGNDFANSPQLAEDIVVYGYTGGALVQEARLPRGGAADPVDRRSPGGPVLADLDADDALEIVVGNRDGTLNGYSVSGTTLVQDWSFAMDGPVSAPPAVFDVDGDGEADVVVADESINSLVIVDTGNRLPVLTAIGDRTVAEDALLEFTVSASDADGDALSLSTGGLPAGASFVDGGSGAGTFSWTPGFDQAGAYSVQFSADDGEGTSSQTIVVTVTNVNRAPVLDAIGDRTANEGTQRVFFVTGSDADAGALTFSALGLPSGAVLEDEAPNVARLDWTPDFDAAGAHVVEVTVTDPEGGTDSETFTIDVSDVDRAPVLAPIGNQQVDEDQLLQFTVSAADPDGDLVALSADGLPGGASFDTGTGLFLWTPTFTQGPANYPVTFTATAGALSAGEDIVISVGNANRPPVFDAVPPKTVAEASPLSFVVLATDPDGETLTYSATGLPTGASFNAGTHTFSWTPGYTQAGAYVVTFHVTDGSSTDALPVGITVTNTNRPPALQPTADRTIKVNRLLSFPLFGSDPDGDALAYSAGGMPPGATLSASLKVFSWRPTPDQLGPWTVTFFVTDTSGASASDVVVITVTQNVAPAITLNGPAVLDLGQSGTFSAAGTTDPDGTSSLVQYAWDFDPSDGFSAQATGVSTSRSFSSFGTKTVTVRATDQDGIAAFRTMDVAIDDYIVAQATMPDADAVTDGASVYRDTFDLVSQLEVDVTVADDAGGTDIDGAGTLEVVYRGLTALGSTPVGASYTFDIVDGVGIVYLTPSVSVGQGLGSWLPGLYEMTVTVSADSRAPPGVAGPETSIVVGKFWIAPAPLDQPR